MLGRTIAHEAIKSAANHWGCSEDMILGESRRSEVCQARFAVMYALHQRGFAKAHIGRLLQRDHATVMHGIKRAEALLSDPDYSALVERLSE